MNRPILTFLFLLGCILSTPNVLADDYWKNTQESIKSGSRNIARTSKVVWQDTKKISIDFWHDSKDFSIDTWDKTKKSIHKATASSTPARKEYSSP